MSYVSETEKLDRYMTMKQGAIMVVTDPSTDWSNMKNFRNFLLEWGLAVVMLTDREDITHVTTLD